MVEIFILPKLVKQIQKNFKKESTKIFDLFENLKENPKKGKVLGNVGNIIIKELKYKSYRFYFLIQGNKLKILSNDELKNILIKFVRMSDKKSQQKTINEIKKILIKIGSSGF